MSKTKKPYDYIGELAMHWDVNMNAEPGVKRILRKLVREAVIGALAIQHDYFHDADVANRIAKELIR
jgi:hypothetical protein